MLSGITGPLEWKSWAVAWAECSFVSVAGGVEVSIGCEFEKGGRKRRREGEVGC